MSEGRPKNGIRDSISRRFLDNIWLILLTYLSYAPVLGCVYFLKENLGIK